MKKIAILTLVLMLVASAVAFADGIGAFSAFKNGTGHGRRVCSRM